MEKFSAWAELGWLSTSPYYDFWGRILTGDLKPYLENADVADIGAGNAKIWQAAFEQGLTLKSLELIDPHLNVEASLRINPVVRLKVAALEQALPVEADVLLFKSSFHFAWEVLQSALFDIAKDMTIINLSMPKTISWPVSEKFKILYAPTCLDFGAIAARHSKKCLVEKTYAYPVVLERSEWIRMLENRFVSCLHHSTDEVIACEIAWAHTHLPETLHFDDVIDCAVYR